MINAIALAGESHPHIVIGMAHHPFHVLHDFDRRCVQARAERSCLFFHCGHLHEPEAQATGFKMCIRDREQQAQRVNAVHTAFVNLLNLTRREHKLTWEQFSQKVDVDLAELMGIESNENYKPTPRTVNKIAQFIHVPAEKLFVLSGLARARDIHLSLIHI